MIEINVHNDIASKLHGTKNNPVFSADIVREIFDKNKSERDFIFNINSNGGLVSEALLIYDIIRRSGKNIYTNIEGACHSAAIIILLSAPKNHRTANINSRALIHQVEGAINGYANIDDLEAMAEDMKLEQNAILDIYAERTGYNRSKLEILMKEEKTHTARELLLYGFISKINKYNTNKKRETMAKEKKLTFGQRIDGFLNRTSKLLGDVVNYDYSDVEGNVLFSTESEEDTLAVGDAVTIAGDETAGTFELSDGRVVTVEDNVVTSIEEVAEEPSEVEEEIAALKEELQNAKDLIIELNNKIKSSYYAPNRTNNPKQKTDAKKTFEELKNEAKEKRAKMRGGK